MLPEWYSVTINAFINLWEGFLQFIPILIGALVVFIVGWFISSAIGKIVASGLKKVKFNTAFEKGAWKEAMEKADIKVDPAGFLGAIVKWILVIVFISIAVEILGLYAFANFLNNILDYIPNVIVAVLILVVAIVISDIVEKLVRAAVEGTKVGYAHLAGMIVRWSIWVFAILAILTQLRIAPGLMQTFFAGIVALFAIAGGLAFGLGGKDVAAEILQDLKRKLKS